MGLNLVVVITKPPPTFGNHTMDAIRSDHITMIINPYEAKRVIEYLDFAIKEMYKTQNDTDPRNHDRIAELMGIRRELTDFRNELAGPFDQISQIDCRPVSCRHLTNT